MAVRLATACDLGITARIAARGFSLSPWNAFYRPYAKDYPEDMENSYRREQEEALLSGKKLFTVIETNVKNASGQSQDIVGFAIWNYAEGSDRARHDLPESTIGRPTSDENKSAPLNHTLEWLLRLWTRIYDTLTYPRDSSTDPYRGKLLFDATDAAVHKYESIQVTGGLSLILLQVLQRLHGARQYGRRSQAFPSWIWYQIVQIWNGHGHG